jgi:hypothetical protein
VDVAQRLKRTLVAFSLEVTCLLFACLANLLWSGVSITGLVLADVLLLGFLSILFAFDYAIMSKHEGLDPSYARSRRLSASSKDVIFRVGDDAGDYHQPEPYRQDGYYVDWEKCDTSCRQNHVTR